MSSRAETTVTRLLEQAGISINGNDPWDIHVHDRRLYRRVLHQGSLGLGEAWMDEWWDCPALDRFFERIFNARLEERVRINLPLLANVVRYRLFNLQSVRRAFEIGEYHYDIGNDLFERMLDRRLVYSCGYWRRADDLDQAQHDKLELICRKLELQPGMRLLDIGCGWGSLVRHAAEHHGVEAVGVTVSEAQADYARRVCRNLDVRIEIMDYRDIRGQFDRIASVGMVEHVGRRNYPAFMRAADRCLRPGGLFLLHTIGRNRSGLGVDPWIGKYIFPNGMLPSLAQLGRAVEPHFIIEDVHNFGTDYDHTLMAWHDNFRHNWPELAEQYGPRFYRMWCYYLLSCAAAFRTRRIQLYQFLLGKRPRPRPAFRQPR